MSTTAEVERVVDGAVTKTNKTVWYSEWMHEVDRLRNNGFTYREIAVEIKKTLSPDNPFYGYGFNAIYKNHQKWLKQLVPDEDLRQQTMANAISKMRLLQRLIDEEMALPYTQVDAEKLERWFNAYHKFFESYVKMGGLYNTNMRVGVTAQHTGQQTEAVAMAEVSGQGMLPMSVVVYLQANYHEAVKHGLDDVARAVLAEDDDIVDAEVLYEGGGLALAPHADVTMGADRKEGLTASEVLALAEQ